MIHHGAVQYSAYPLQGYNWGWVGGIPAIAAGAAATVTVVGVGVNVDVAPLLWQGSTPLYFIPYTSYVAPLLWQVLAFSLIENHHEPVLRQFLARNMQETLQQQAHIPVGVLLKPLVKQASHKYY